MRLTLYVVQAAGADPAALEKARFVKDGFSWPAFLFAQLWLLYHRLWLVLLAWVAVEIAYFFLVAPRVTPGTTIAVDLLAHLWLGFEGNRLRLKRNAAVNDVIEARDREEAEIIFFRRQLGESEPGRP